MTCRARSARENQRFSCLEKVPEDFFHGLLGYADIEHPAVGMVNRLWINSLPDQGCHPGCMAPVKPGGFHPW
jgi:hypothetical protein